MIPVPPYSPVEGVCTRRHFYDTTAESTHQTSRLHAFKHFRSIALKRNQVLTNDSAVLKLKKRINPGKGREKRRLSCQ